MRNKTLVSGSARTFIILSICFATIAGQDDARISATWQVQKYDITATLPTTDVDRNISAKATLNLINVSQRPASSLTLRISPNATLSTITINGVAADFSKSEEKLGSSSLQRVAVRMSSAAPGATISAVVDYKLSVKENSGLAAVSSVGAHCLPLSFWYPTPNSWYFARGADFAAVRLNISAPGKTVVASGKEAGGGFEQTLFVQPFFVAGNYERSDSNGVEVYLARGSSPDEKKRAAELTSLLAEARSFYSAAFGAPPDATLRIAAVKRGGGFGSGGTLLVDEAVFRRSKLDSGIVNAAADMVAKLWFADSVRLGGDGYGAIREGLSRFMATQFIESKFGKQIADIERMRQRNAYSTVSQRDAPIIQVAPLDDYYYSTVAYKGAMTWRLLSRKAGQDEFYKRIRTGLEDRNVTLSEFRGLFPEHQDFLDAMFDKITDTNLLIGLPQSGNGETKAALRNTGSIDATVTATATFENGEKLSAPTTIRSQSFGEIAFRSPGKVVKLEIDSEKLFPQVDYSDDIAPRDTTDSDLLLFVKREFDKQDFKLAETNARRVLKDHPNFDEVRVLLGRSLLGQNRNADAELEFKAVLGEKLPTARSIAWANFGLADAAHRTGQNTAVARYAEEVIRGDADFGASLAARVLRNRVAPASAIPDDVKAYFTAFDRTAVANRKAEIEALTLGGEASRFVSGVSGNVVEWKTQPTHVDQLGTDTLLVETQMSLKLLNREVETGMAVYRLVRTASGWRLNNVDIFEVR